MNKNKVALVLCDIQQKVMPHILKKKLILKNTSSLLESTNFVNHQIKYIQSFSLLPDKFGNCLLSDTYQIHSSEKNKYSIINDEFIKNLKKKEIDTIILTGVETHWCIYQSALELLELNKKVIIPKDAVSSQNLEDHRSALNQLYKYGCIETTTRGLLSQFYTKPSSNGIQWYLNHLKKEKQF